MNKIFNYTGLLILLTLTCQYSFAFDLNKSINNHQQQFEKVALQIWDLAEVGYQEYKSSNLLRETLSEEGFRIQDNVANIPTAFIAEYGKGFPVIGILGEFDAPTLNKSLRVVSAVDLKDRLDLHRKATRQLEHADGAAGMLARLGPE